MKQTYPPFIIMGIIWIIISKQPLCTSLHKSIPKKKGFYHWCRFGAWKTFCCELAKDMAGPLAWPISITKELTLAADEIEK
jgi:hypothetical protein